MTRARSTNARAATLLAAVVIVVTIVLSWGTRPGKVGPGFKQVDAHVAITVVTPDRAQAILGKLIDPGQLSAIAASAVDDSPLQEVVGQLSFNGAFDGANGGRYAFFLLDSRTGRPASVLYGASASRANVASGWDSTFQQIPNRYPKLKGLRQIRSADDAYSSPGGSLSFLATQGGPVTFVGAWTAANRIALDMHSPQLQGILTYFAASGNLQWAHSVSISALQTTTSS